MDFKEFEEDYKYFIGFGICASAKYFQTIGSIMIQAAKALKEGVVTDIAEGVSYISEYKVKKAYKLLSKSHKNYPDDEVVNSLLNFAKTLMFSVVDDKIQRGQLPNTKDHENNKIIVLEDLKKIIENTTDESIRNIVLNCKDIIEHGVNLNKNNNR